MSCKKRKIQKNSKHTAHSLQVITAQRPIGYLHSASKTIERFYDRRRGTNGNYSQARSCRKFDGVEARVGWNFRVALFTPRVIPDCGACSRPFCFSPPPWVSPRSRTTTSFAGGGSQTLSGSNDASSGNGEGSSRPEVRHIRAHTYIELRVDVAGGLAYLCAQHHPHRA